MSWDVLGQGESTFPELVSIHLHANCKDMAQLIKGIGPYTRITFMEVDLVYEDNASILRAAVDALEDVCARRIKTLGFTVGGRPLTPLVYQHIRGLERCSGLEVLEFQSNPAVILVDEDIERLASALSALRSISIRGTVPLIDEDPYSPTRPTFLALGNLVAHCPSIETITLDVKGTTVQPSRLETAKHSNGLSPMLRMIDLGWTIDRPVVDTTLVARLLCQLSSHADYAIRTKRDNSVAPASQDLM